MYKRQELFHRVVYNVFGKELQPGWEADHALVKSAILHLFDFPMLGLKHLTPKLHVLLEHAPVLCDKR